MNSCSARDWWRRDDLFERYCVHLITSELRRLRPQIDVIAKSITIATSFQGQGLALDSLERLRIANTVGDALNLQDIGNLENLMEADSVGELVSLSSMAMASQPDAPSFYSSGSQGIPKRVTHRWEKLQPELEHWRQQAKTVQRIVSLVPSHHIYGFIFTVALPNLLEVPVLDGAGAIPVSVAHSLKDGDLVVGHPFFWRLMAGKDLPRQFIAVSSGGAVDRELFFDLVASDSVSAFEVYGSTETAGVAVRYADDFDFELLPWWDRFGIDLRDADGSTVELPDRVEWFGDRRLNPVGRKDGQVQVAGQNVSPAKIAAVLRAHPMVADARVRLMQSAEGERMKAFVVPNGPAEGMVKSLEHWCLTRLSAAERPKAWKFGDCVPKSAEGKDVDWPTD